MHFYYLDEAGDTGQDLQSAEQPIFVLGGVSVRDEGWNRTQDDFLRIIGNYFQANVPANFELHAEELLSPQGDGPFNGHERDRRNALAKQLLGLLATRHHGVHLIGLDKQRMRDYAQGIPQPTYEPRIPFLLAYDYLITYINWYVREKLGQSARGMIILDEKSELSAEIDQLTDHRRFRAQVQQRVKWIVEFSYPVDSRKNPMVQLSDLVVYCAKKFLELDGGYRDGWPDAAKQFYAECYALIDDRIDRKALVPHAGRALESLNTYLETVHSHPVGQWRRRYQI